MLLGRRRRVGTERREGRKGRDCGEGLRKKRRAERRKSESQRMKGRRL